MSDYPPDFEIFIPPIYSDDEDEAGEADDQVSRGGGQSKKALKGKSKDKDKGKARAKEGEVKLPLDSILAPVSNDPGPSGQSSQMRRGSPQLSRSVENPRDSESYHRRIPLAQRKNEDRELRARRYSVSRGRWKNVTKYKSSGNNDPNSEYIPSAIRIVTWNLDYFTQCQPQRMVTALDYLQNEVFKCQDGRAPEPCCLLLQEVHVRAFDTILDHEWIKSHFMVTPVSPKKWPSAVYGNVTLISREVPLGDAHLLVFGGSRQDRTAVVTDVYLSVPSSKRNSSSRVVKIRVINTHLDSLPEGEESRGIEMILIAKYLKQRGLYGAVVCGDMNSIGESDRTLTEKNGLWDAWKKGDDDESGFTWGYQGGGKFPAARLDKVLYVPKGGQYRIDAPERIGIELRTEAIGKTLFTSDHYGLTTTLHIVK